MTPGTKTSRWKGPEPWKSAFSIGRRVAQQTEGRCRHQAVIPSKAESDRLVRHLLWLKIKNSNDLQNHGTGSKHFSRKKWMKLSHGNFWPHHESRFSKRAVNLTAE